MVKGFFRERFGHRGGFSFRPSKYEDSGFDYTCAFEGTQVSILWLDSVNPAHELPRIVDAKARAGKVGAYLVVVIPYASAPIKEFFLEHRINYLDLSGNACIKADPMHIEIEGKQSRVSVGRMRDPMGGNSGKILTLLRDAINKERFTRAAIAKVLGLTATSIYPLIAKLEAESLVKTNPITSEVTITSEGARVVTLKRATGISLRKER